MSTTYQAPLPYRTFLRWWHGTVAGIALVIAPLLFFVTVQPIKVLPRLTPAPSMSLIDSSGERLTSLDLLGTIVLYNFTYTNCTGDCPSMTAQSLELQRALDTIDTQGIPVRILTVSIDPERDTPEAMAVWGQNQGVDPRRWLLASGNASSLKQDLGGGFGVWYEEQEDASFRYDPTWVLVDGTGLQRAKYAAADMSPAVLERDLALVVNEIVNSTGVEHLFYEAAHTFLCYP